MKKLLSFLNKLNDRFWARIAANTEVSVYSLGAFRIIVGLYILIFSFKTYTWIGDAPNLFFNPPALSIASLFKSFPPVIFFKMGDIFLLAFLVLIVLGVRAKIFAILYVLFSIILTTFNYSFGKIDHGIIAYVAIGCMAFSGWGNKFALVPDKYEKRNMQRALGLLAVVLAFGMFTAGFPKAFNWINLDLDSNGFLSWYYKGKFFYGRTHFLAPYVEQFPIYLLKGFDFIAVAFELSAFFMLLWSARTWKLWLITAILFHLMVALFLNINFTVMLIAYMAFVNFDRIINISWLGKKTFRIILIILLTTVISARVWLWLNKNYQQGLFSDDTLSVGIGIWIVALVIFIKDLLKTPSTPNIKDTQMAK